MARTIDERLSSLSSRRKGSDRIALLAEDSAALNQYFGKAYTTEQWEKRAANQPYTRYSLGAMQEVDPD
jgi:hypothetical protein